MVLPQTIVALAPIVAPSFTKVGIHLSFDFGYFERGFKSLVKTAEGPTKTKSSKVILLQTSVLD